MSLIKLSVKKEKIVCSEDEKRSIVTDYVTNHIPANFRPVAKYIKEQIEKEQLTERPKSVIEILKKNPNITMEEAGNLLNLGRTTVYQTLKELKQKGYVSFAGRKSCGEWLVSEPETEYGI